MVLVSLTNGNETYSVETTNGEELEHLEVVKVKIPTEDHALYLTNMREGKGYKFYCNEQLLGFVYVLSHTAESFYIHSIWVKSNNPTDAALFLSYLQTLYPVLLFRPLGNNYKEFESFCTETSLKLFRRKKTTFVRLINSSKYSFDKLCKYLGLYNG